MKDPALRSVSLAARGLYIDLLCLMWECPERGVLKTGNTLWDAQKIGNAIVTFSNPIIGHQNDTKSLLDELVCNGVVTLRQEDGAIISRRMVREELERSSTRKRVAEYRQRNGNVRESNNHSSSSTSVTETYPNPSASAEGNQAPPFWRGRGKAQEVAFRAWGGTVVITLPKGRRLMTKPEQASLVGKRAAEILEYFRLKGFECRIEREENSPGEGDR